MHARALCAQRMITRRAFTFALGALAACSWLGSVSPAAGAQPPGSRRHIGVLLVLLSPAGKEAQAFRQGLRDAGYIEGRDVVIEWRSAGGDYARAAEQFTLVVNLKTARLLGITISESIVLRADEVIH
jgi:putative ABC transport system substrate-binding protein